MEILTTRLKVIPCNEELLENDEEISGHISHYLDALSNDPTMEGWGVWFVISQQDNSLIGDIGFKGKPQHGVVEIGYGIHKEAQNHGYATEAVEALIHWAFHSGLVTKIVAECLKSNEASIKVLKKLSMNKTGEDDSMIYWEKTLEH
ncbi:GNAT family N-acetyltransferase [Metabacillus litoralis]|uniref:GNAT family N-acetyltransferase n=1 Tax=Metabacillus litoralis TaxID=152268 RepID=UPI001CFF42AD|nr:GNAT family N-acetyltransferase [Metabacillus litoralis]